MVMRKKISCMNKRKMALVKVGMLSLSVHLASAAYAQEAPAGETDDGARIADILVTAQKRGVAERAQDVPIAITAFNDAALDRNHVRDLQMLGVQIPNVNLSSVGTIPGFANFSIRGFGINSSIPSIEPAVGVFIDGVYLGQSSGVVLDMFDLASVEVLRGPQGTLFGRNTTGGAVSLTTRRPGDVFQVRGRVVLETGPQYTVAASVEGPLIEGKLRAKVTGYTTHDDGWFHNVYDNSKFGRQSMAFIRPTVVWDVNEDIDTTLIYEYGSGDGDGPSVTNPINNIGLKLNIDYPGYFDINRQSLTSETNIHVPFGNGVITNIAGWRKLEQVSAEDFDGRPQSLFNIQHFLTADQFSEELRYAGTFGSLKMTIGGFYFQQKFNYIEERTISAGTPFAFGGKINQHSWAVFGQAELAVVDQFSLIAGGRYSWEKKRAIVATGVASASLCNFAARTCNYNFPGPAYGAEPGEHVWKNFTPKLGFQWKATDDVQLYGSWSKGIRSGGYNVRSTSLLVGPGPYDPEEQSSFELGMKSDLFDRRVRFNAAVFHNTIKDLQRDVSVPFVGVGTVQLTQNVGTAKVKGFEAELTIVPVQGLTIGGNVGYLNGHYSKLKFDLNGASPGLGTDLKIARLSPWSYGANMAYSRQLSDNAKATLNVNFNHRDESPFSDNNAGILNPVNDLGASFSLSFDDDKFVLSMFGRNLLNRLHDGAHAATGFGGFFSPAAEGRVIGAEFRFKI